MRSATSIIVRRYAETDAAFVLALADEAFSEYDGGGGRSASKVRAMVSAARTHTLVAERANRLVGFVALDIGGGAHIAAIAVASHARGRGVGVRLLHAAEKLAMSLGATTVELETGEANLAALDLFVSAGYRIEGRIPRFYRCGYDALTLRRNLDHGGTRDAK
jgi:ribosomal protein S18 acetylase RimI-like enzyme